MNTRHERAFEMEQAPDLFDSASAGLMAGDVWKMVCSGLTENKEKKWIINKHLALHLHAGHCCFAGLQMALWEHVFPHLTLAICLGARCVIGELAQMWGCVNTNR